MNIGTKDSIYAEEQLQIMTNLVFHILQSCVLFLLWMHKIRAV